MKQRNKKITERRKRRVLSGVLAVLIVVALAIGLMPNEQVYAAEKTSDGNTTGSYAQNLGDNSSTRYAGRVWTDKTVYTGNATFTGDADVTVENDSDFLVAYSALATTQNVTGKSSVPVDVVFVIDNSNSMDDSVGGRSGQSRLEATVEAVNTSIETIMDSHPDSRVAVVLYGSSAHTLMPLGHYSASTNLQHSGDYIWYDSETDFFGNTDTTFGSVANGRNLEMTSGERGTNIHMGVDVGMDILKGATGIGEGASKHVPALILLSDGAATYAGSGNWWDPSGSQGIGSEASVTFSLETAMHAQYQKQLVNNHYGVDADADTACQIYTIGMGIEQLSGSQRNIARLALNPGTYITENNDEANAMKNAWNSYLSGQNPTMQYPSGTNFWGNTQYSDYTFRHPGSDDISAIAYNDGYYSAENADDVANVFDDITSDIVSSSAQAPTQIEGGDPLKSGYLTYTDPIGEYMEVKDIKSIIYGGEQFTQKSSSTDGNTTTYTFEGPVIESPVYGELDVSSIIITVTKDADGNETLTVKIPAAAIPLRVNTVDIDENGAITNTNNNAYPARILYTVGAREGINLETLEGVSDDYISSHLTEDGQKVNFYSNKYSRNTQNNKTVGDAKVTFTPAETNPFFYVQEDTPLYTAEDTNAVARSVNNDDTLYYFQITYYEGNSEQTVWVSRPGSSFWHDGSTDVTLKTLDGGQVAIKKGAPRLGYLDDFAQTKAENTTGTAEQVFHPVYDGNGQFTVYLGNNGLLQTDAPKSLTVEKEVTTSNSLTAPDADFTFEVTVASKAGTAGDAILTGSDGQTTKTELTFDADGKATFTLKDGQSMEILNIGEGVAYTVKEINLPAGFTSDAADNTKTGTVSGADENNIVTFTNTYNVTPVTTEDLGIRLGGTKSITGRDFQAGDEFVFTIAAAQVRPDAPLPDEDIDGDGNAATATVEPTSGSEVTFKFGNITFDKPGEYRYIIRENTGALPGVDYDGATYRVNIIVRDNGDGTMSLASTEGGLTGIGGLNYPTNPFIQVWDGDQEGAVVSAAAFENSYNAASAEAVIQGVKVLNSTNSDRILADGDFTFKIEALGYNSDGGDQFNQIPDGEPAQPMPANTEVINIANGNVNFAAMTFTQDMIGNTYGYKITEKLPQGVNADNPTLNGITYDTSEKIVKVTVTRSDEGGIEHVVATVTPNDGTAEAAKNFTFTNKYEPSSVTIGEDTGNAITVQKTFTGRTWNDSDVFEYSLIALDNAPMPSTGGDVISIGKPASGDSNTAIFGNITFTKEGVYKYEITETDGGLGGVTYDKHTAKVTVSVTEDEKTGTLSAKVEYDNSTAENNSDKDVQDAAAFTNTYKAVFDPDTTVNLNGTKELTGKDLTEGMFYFYVDPQDGAPMGDFAPTGDSTAMNPNQADGSIQLLKNVTYTEAGDYVYIIKEQIPSNKEKGMTYDESEYRVTVTVTDDQQGNLTASEPKIEKKAAGAVDYVEADAVVFENNYEPLSITIAPLQITKVLDGDRNTPLQDGEFSFEMSVVSANPEDGITLPQQTVVENKADGTVPFGDITFTKVGTYKVQVKEVVPDEADKVPGVEYDTHVRTTTFTVTDNAGQLAVQRSGYDGSRTFTNEYKTTGTVTGATDLEVTKNLTGRDWQKDDAFTFTLAAANEETKKAVENEYVILPENAKGIIITYNAENPDAPKTASFSDITITQPGDYVFVISESVPEDEKKISGISYDDSKKYVFVTAEDQGNGTLHITERVMDGIETGAQETTLTFTNTYQAGAAIGVPADFQMTKDFTGHEWTADYAFEFVMSPVSGKLTDGTEVASADIPMPKADDNAGVTIDGDGNAHKTISGPQEGTKASFDFGTITYDKAGTYVYEVKEAKAGTTDKGVTYSKNTAIITVTVTDKDATTGASTGQLTATASVANGTFKNTYEASANYDAQGAGGLDITKKLNNRNMTADQFTFTIEATGDNAADAAKKLGLADGETSTTVKNNDGAAGAAVSVVGNPFENMIFDETDDGVTYTYTIKENGTSGEGDYAGYKLDETTYTVSITATDKGNGTMTVKTVVNDGAADKEYIDNRATVAFENTYDAGDVIVGAEGAAQIKANKTLKNDNIANYARKFNFQVTSGDVVVAEGTNDGNGNITFDDITYTTENLAAAATADGSDKVGKANLDTTGDKDVYTFTYSVSEVTDSLPGGVSHISGDTNVTVTVTDDRHGKLDVEVGYADGASSVEFVNTYGKDGKAELNLKGNKKIVPGEGLTEAPALVDDTYTFEITGNAAEDGTPAPMPQTTTAKNKSGAVEFGPITFTMENVFGTTQTTQDVTVEEEQTTEDTTVEGETTTAEGEAEAVAGEEAAVTEGETVTAGVTNADEGIELQTAGRTKTFTYTIKEIAGSVPGVDNDTTVKTITVKVTDNGDGTIDVAKTEAAGHDEGNDFTFTNVYNVDPKGSSLTGDGGFKITKSLTGRDMTAGEIAFRLKEQNGDWWTAPTNPAAADGEAAEITFGAVHFTKPGTYTYTLEEEQGNLAGVEYDSNKYTVIATVTDKDADGNYTGELEVTWQINGAADNIVAFKNTYTADPTSVSLGAGKLIKGRDLKAGEFSFLLSDADGKEIDTAKNEENGAVTFKTITFDKAGTYSYEIREVLPEDDDSKTDGIQSSNVTYDENIYHVTVDVKDNTEKGCLEATVTYEDSDGAPVFVNTYTEPKKETPAGNDGGGTILGVKTGDVAEILPLLIVMAAAIVVIIAMSVILIRRRRR